MSANTPKHYGFAQVPRQILRGEKYKGKLSLAEKGLYSCLKDICGDNGECYYSLRNLALEIGTSASTLTRLIPVLRDTGLIYAEKKVRGTGENKHEIWHIRIVNIWQENDALYKSQDCSILKQSDDNSVSNRNNVADASTSVSNCNNCVSNCNKDCFILLANEYLDSNNNQEEESNSNDSLEPRIVANATDTHASQSLFADFSAQESKTEETVFPVAKSTTRKAVSGKEKGETPSKKSEEAKGPPAMPSPEATWNDETAVQIMEAKKGRRYSDTTRTQEKSEAKRVLKMEYEDHRITREEFEKAVDDMMAWPFWKEHTNVRPMIKYLRKDDKIIAILDEIKMKKQPIPIRDRQSSAKPQGSQQPVVSAQISREKSQRNLERQRQRAIASGNYQG